MGCVASNPAAGSAAGSAANTPSPVEQLPAATGTVLAVALGGSSDIIGVLAWARTLGFKSIVLVQPGSQARGAPKEIGMQRVQPAAAGASAPGGDFFDNGSMVSYLLSLDTSDELAAGYYLVQPKDEGAGFSAASLEATTTALLKLLTEHSCTAVAGLDFGGDVALPRDESAASVPHIMQRDWLNLLAAVAAATKAGAALHLVAASPGVDAAAVAPAYAGCISKQPAPRLFEMSKEGALEPKPDTPLPECALTTLPQALFDHRLDNAVEKRFCELLVEIDERIIADAPPQKRGEHASKTYHMHACCGKLLAESADAPFVAVGVFRAAEKARALLHSDYCRGLYKLDYLAST